MIAVDPTSAPRMPSYGDRVATASGSTGRYLGDGLVLWVSPMDSDLAVGRVDTRSVPDPALPVPTDRELAACWSGLSWASLAGVSWR